MAVTIGSITTGKARTTGLLDDRGNYDASGNTFPTTGGSGVDGAIMKGDLWRISVAGTLGGTLANVGDELRALVDTPGQTAGNWGLINTGLGAAVARIPSADEKAAFCGTSGVTPSASNPFTDSADDRLITNVADVTAAEAASGTDILLIYVKSLDNSYRYLAAGSAYTVDHLNVLSTAEGGNSRWLGIGPHYIYDGLTLHIKAPEVIAAVTGALSVAQCSGTSINNYGQGAANTQTLPTCAPGLNGLATIITTGMGAFSLKPASGEIIILDGTALAADHKVSLATPALGDGFSFIGAKNGVGTYVWIVRTVQGVSSDGGT
jgi:hypothetical protein